MAGEEIVAGTMLAGGMIVYAIFMIVMFTIGIFALVFWILMLIDVIKRDFKQENDKIMWVLIVVLTGIIGALIYYFIVKRENKK